MASFTIPGVHGHGSNKTLSSSKKGTLARCASSLPAPVGIDAEAVYHTAMRELLALKNRNMDLLAQLKFINSLPYELKRQVMYDHFASFFRHYLPKWFLRHYVWGNGVPVTLTLQEMIDCNPLISLFCEKSPIHTLLKQAAKEHSCQSIPFDVKLPSGALTNGTLGQFTTQAKGVLITGSNGTWHASGTMSFYDKWNFDSKVNEENSGRTSTAEIKTWYGRTFLPGQGFEIFSVVTTFTQNQNDALITWAGGIPHHVRDLIGMADNEPSKADALLDKMLDK